MEQNSIVNLLDNSGFKEISQNKYNRTLAETYSVDAFINGHGVIFHLIKGKNEVQMTIQADTFEDAAKAFSQLMEYLITHISLLNNGLSIKVNTI